MQSLLYLDISKPLIRLSSKVSATHLLHNSLGHKGCLLCSETQRYDAKPTLILHYLAVLSFQSSFVLYILNQKQKNYFHLWRSLEPACTTPVLTWAVLGGFVCPMPALLVHLHFQLNACRVFLLLPSTAGSRCSRESKVFLVFLLHIPLSNSACSPDSSICQCSILIIMFWKEEIWAGVTFCSVAWPEAGTWRHCCSTASRNNNGNYMLWINRLPQQSKHLYEKNGKERNKKFQMKSAVRSKNLGSKKYYLSD